MILRCIPRGIYNSGKEITQTGKEKGISYGKADKLYSNDRPISGIDVTLNLFFDGTQNNKVNSNLGEESGLSNRLDDSYTNDYSNVVRSYDAVDPNAENQISTYVEGIGTVDGKRDSLKWAGVFPNNLGSPMGEGDRGIKAKITKGCIKAAYNLGLKFKNKDINKLIVNVFGFSRGAAAARHFIYLSQKKAKSQISDQRNIRVSPPREYELAESEKEEDLEFLIDKKHQSFIDQYGYFGACLVKNKLKIKRIVFNFAGLYDTVASFGGNHRGNAFVNNDSQQLHLHVIKKCKMVMHFVTQEEFRENFSLTNIDASGIKGIEFTLPGVHSDIGGGYRDQSRENVVIHKETLYYKGKPKECEEYKKILIEEGWYTEKDIEIREVVTEGVFYSIYQYLLIGKRKLSNQYDRIPLQKMLEYSKQFGVKYQQKVQSDHKISDPFIQKIYAQLQSYFSICNQIRNTYIDEQNKGVKINEQEYLQKIKQISYLKYIPSADLKKLRNGYLHWSSNLNRAGMEPRISKPKPQQERTRTTLKG